MPLENFFKQTEFLHKDLNSYCGDFQNSEKIKPPGQFFEFQQSRKWQEFGIFADFSIFTQF